MFNKKIVPDLIDKMRRRFSILTTIQKYQPVGRRTLSELLNLTERVLRSETDLLKQQELISVKSTGMTLTSQGLDVVSQLNAYFDQYTDYHHLAQSIKSTYQLDEVHVIPGDSDKDSNVKVELGRIAGQLLEKQLYDHAIVSVTGGSTMASVSDAMSHLPSKYSLCRHVAVLVKMSSFKRTQFVLVWLKGLVAVIQRYMCLNK